jgi:predicted nucleic acid-binding protein
MAARAKAPRQAAKGLLAAEKLAEYLAGREHSRTKPSRGTGGVLVDTCAWIDFLRPGATPLSQALDRLLRGEEVFTCGQVLLELLQGVRSESDRAAVLGALGSLEYLEVDPHVWVRAAGLAVSLKSEGRRLPQSDLLIAALAIEHGVSVLTADSHFAGIPGLALLPVENGMLT